jgi:hypothetical protein
MIPRQVGLSLVHERVLGPQLQVGFSVYGAKVELNTFVWVPLCGERYNRKWPSLLILDTATRTWWGSGPWSLMRSRYSDLAFMGAAETASNGQQPSTATGRQRQRCLHLICNGDSVGSQCTRLRRVVAWSEEEPRRESSAQTRAPCVEAKELAAFDECANCVGRRGAEACAVCLGRTATQRRYSLGSSNGIAASSGLPTARDLVTCGARPREEPYQDARGKKFVRGQRGIAVYSERAPATTALYATDFGQVKNSLKRNGRWSAASPKLTCRCGRETERYTLRDGND